MDKQVPGKTFVSPKKCKNGDNTIHMNYLGDIKFGRAAEMLAVWNNFRTYYNAGCLGQEF